LLSHVFGDKVPVVVAGEVVGTAPHGATGHRTTGSAVDAGLIRSSRQA
jgi:hypothetical protein